MKTKRILFFISFIALTLNTYSQQWTAGSGILFADPTSTKIGIGTNNPNNLIQVVGLIDFDNSLYGTLLGNRIGGSITTGVFNTSVGYRSFYSNTSGNGNTALGFTTLYSNTLGSSNTALGRSSMYFNTTGSYNIAIGYNGLYSNTTGSYNTAIGFNGLNSNATGNYNTALGYNANTSAGNFTNATAIGAFAYVGASNSLVLGGITGINGGTNTNVGIGTTAPGALLDVGGTTQINALIYPRIGMTSNADRIEALQLKNSSSGTSAEMRFVSAANDNTYLAFTQPGSANTSTTFFGVPKYSGSFIFNSANGGTARDLYLGTCDNKNLSFGTNNILRLTILNDGKVGIGTSNPNAKLQVGNTYTSLSGITPFTILGVNANSIQSIHLENSSTGNAAEMRFVAKADDASYLAFTQPGSGNTATNLFGIPKNNGSFIFNSGAARKLVIGTFLNEDVVFGTNSTENVRIKAGGNVGIGTTNPTSILHTIASGLKTTNYTGNLLTNTAYSSTEGIIKAGLQVISTGTWNGKGSKNIGLWVSAVNGAEETFNYDAIFNGGGTVGIGTPAPGSMLQINGNAAIGYDATTGAPENGLCVSGNVIIGTLTNPTGYKLVVEGKVGAREYIAAAYPNWPDYVFANEYELMPLADLENFIKENKHLPNVPSAEEVKKDGINLGEMDAILLEKVEELTIYLIDLKKENEQLKVRISNLENK